MPQIGGADSTISPLASWSISGSSGTTPTTIRIRIKTQHSLKLKLQVIKIYTFYSLAYFSSEQTNSSLSKSKAGLYFGSCFFHCCYLLSLEGFFSLSSLISKNNSFLPDNFFDLQKKFMFCFFQKSHNHHILQSLQWESPNSSPDEHDQEKKKLIHHPQ